MAQAQHAFAGILLVLAALVLGARASAQDDPNVFRSQIARIELAKPTGWHFLDLESIARHRATAKLKDEELQEAILQFATAPLVVATKHPEPYDSLNPSLQVLVRPLGQLTGASGAKILELVKPTLESAFEDFQLLEPVTTFELGGVPAARLTATYTVQTQTGAVFPTKAIMIVVPRGSYMYQFSFSAPPSGKDAIGREVSEVLDSVRFLE
jgi:hypothetical protein